MTDTKINGDIIDSNSFNLLIIFLSFKRNSDILQILTESKYINIWYKILKLKK